VKILSTNSIEAYNLPNNGKNQFISIGYDNIPKKMAAEGFEAIFARQILESMRSTLTDGGMFGSGSIGETYSYIMDNAIAETIAKRGDLGLADHIYNQMVKSIESGDRSSVDGNHKNIIKDMAEK